MKMRTMLLTLLVISLLAAPVFAASYTVDTTGSCWTGTHTIAASGDGSVSCFVSPGTGSKGRQVYAGYPGGSVPLGTFGVTYSGSTPVTLIANDRPW
jgi:type 1 fimbria pilin